MARKIWLLGGDERSAYGAEHLKNQGISVQTYGVPHYPDEPLPAAFDRVILPFPSFQGALLRGHSAIPAEELICRIEEGSCVYGGLLGSHKEAMEARGCKVFDLYGTEPLTTSNAALTAEGAVSLAIERSPLSLCGANCLVIGYGRIGKLLAQRLQSFSAHVTVTARKEANCSLAEAFGFCTDYTGKYLHGLGQFDFVFNTVPAPVLSRKQLGELPQHCLVMELASAPGGFSPADCTDLGLNYVPAPGLPGRFSPQSAGILYTRCILDLISEEEEV